MMRYTDAKFLHPLDAQAASTSLVLCAVRVNSALRTALPFDAGIACWQGFPAFAGGSAFAKRAPKANLVALADLSELAAVSVNSALSTTLAFGTSIACRQGFPALAIDIALRKLTPQSKLATLTHLSRLAAVSICRARSCTRAFDACWLTEGSFLAGAVGLALSKWSSRSKLTSNALLSCLRAILRRSTPGTALAKLA